MRPSAGREGRGDAVAEDAGEVPDRSQPGNLLALTMAAELDIQDWQS